MNQYYLIAQLPSLDAVNDMTPLPITETQFYHLCKGNLGDKMWDALKGLTLVPAKQNEPTGYAFIDAWNTWERNLRFALASVRAGKMKKASGTETEPVSADVLQIARAATEVDDPLAAENYLNRFRLEFLETLRPLDGFSEDMLFYYALKLKIIGRIKQFDETSGRNAYRNIYDSIVRGGEQDVE